MGALTTFTRRKLEGEMPRATVVLTAERRDLETVEGGWVEIRRLSFGEKLQKDQEAMKMRFATDTGDKGDGKRALDAEVAMINEMVTLVEFSRCVLDHNLENENGIKLNFQKHEDVRSLDPRVGQEINDLLAELNDFERQSKRSSTDDKGKSSQV
jgi:hypothetical protein